MLWPISTYKTGATLRPKYMPDEYIEAYGRVYAGRI